MMKTLREVIEITGTTESALRYYNEKGVLSPTAQQESGRKQWLYDDEAIEKLKTVMMLKFIGVSIDKIKEAMDDTAVFKEIVTERLGELKEEQRLFEKQFFVTRVLAVSYGVEMTEAEFENQEAAVVHEAIRKYITVPGGYRHKEVNRAGK